MLPKTQIEAKKKGEKFYYTGIPCKRRHVNNRYASDGSCVSCAFLRANKRYANKKPEILEKDRKHYAANSDKIKARVAARRKAYPDKVRAEKRAEYQRHKQKYIERAIEWGKSNPEKVKQFIKNWTKRNPIRVNNYSVLRRARLKNRLPLWLTEADHKKIKEIYKEARRISWETGVPHQVDHIVPLQGKLVSGLHVPWNLQILTAKENQSKSNRF